VVVSAGRRDGDKWRGAIKGTDTQEQVTEAREVVVRRLRMLAFGQLEHAMRDRDAPLVKEVVIELTEE
jgi:hypothetical protein